MQRRWGVRLQRPAEPAEEGAQQRNAAGRSRRRAASPEWPRKQQRQQQQEEGTEGTDEGAQLGPQQLGLPQRQQEQHAASYDAAERAGQATAAEAAAAGHVALPLVPGVPDGQVEQLALLPAGRPPCGSCATCAAGGQRSGRTLTAIKRWDAQLPGQALQQLEQVIKAQQRCGKCRYCVKAAVAAGRSRRFHGVPCMALSRLRMGKLQAKLGQLQHQREEWIAAQARQAQQRQHHQHQEEEQEEEEEDCNAASDGSGHSVHSQSSSSDSDASNRSRALLRRRQQWQLPLPALDGRLPLPLVPGVPYHRVEQLAEAWGEGELQRCGVCSGCRPQQQQAAAEGDSQEADGHSTEPQLRCIAAAALVTWDRQLGPVTFAAARRVAALPPAQRAQARCGDCRQCRRCQGQQQPCATGVYEGGALSLLLSLCAERCSC